MQEFTSYDFVSTFWFISIWLIYTLIADGIGAKKGNLIGTMRKHRLSWMKQMMHRDNRLVDIQIINSLQLNTSFFASTSLLIVAGLITTLGATEKAVKLLTDFPLTVEISKQMWEIKILSLIIIFIYAFFKFAWAMRQLNYCSILIGSVNRNDNLHNNDDKIAEEAANIATKSGLHSNRGTRAYYYGLALLVWFIHPLLLIPTSIIIALVLFRREFKSQLLKSLSEINNLNKKQGG
ncbi:DUF599 domain-containing protein [Alphaproteobacteria bacterium]|nr:DUF599 domain-containing protein [Alphaproteobacteria bacterium]